MCAFFWLFGKFYEVIAENGEVLLALNRSDGKPYLILECDLPDDC